MDTNDISGLVVDAAVRVHKALGPGMLESAYEACLNHALRKHRLKVEAQVPMPIHFEDVRIDVGYRLDLLVERRVVVELKSVSRLLPIHEAQVLSYIKLGNFPVGLLLNFNVPKMVEGIIRFAN
jgi:GxxExxY protein